VTTKFASLNAAQETTSNTSTAVGAGLLAVESPSGRVSGFLVVTGLSPTAAHVHLAARGTPGAVIVPMTAVAGSNVWVVPDSAAALTSDQIAAFEANNLYFNAHTAANPGGEIRGQLDKVGTARLAQLNAAQESASATSTALGAGILALDAASGRVAGFVVTTGVAATLAHVHQQARGTAGGVIVPMTGGSGVWVVPDTAAALTADQAAAFSSGNLYFNVHSAARPGGEIRGQLDKTGTVKLAALDAAQEGGASTSTAMGAGLLAVDAATGAVSGFAVTSGLSATAAHVHQAARGVQGPVIVPLSGGPSFWMVADAQAALAADQVTAFGAEGLYFNAHTPAHAAGEIRGQIR
jgi:hypothetical protein